MKLWDAPRLRAPFRNRHLFLLDGLGAALALFLAFSARFESFAWGPEYGRFFLAFLATAVPLKLVLFWRCGLYRRLWRHAGVAELEAITLAVGLSAFSSLLIGAWLLPVLGLLPRRVPLSILALDALLTTVVVAAPRLAVRALHLRWSGSGLAVRRRVLIAGAGEAGGVIASELQTNPALGLQPVGFLDDDPEKHGLVMRGLPVLGGLDDLAPAAARVGAGEVVIAMPSAPGAVVRRVFERARTAGVPARTMPSIFEILNGRVGFSMLRPVRIEDLLRREPVQIDLQRVDGMLRDQVVLITGAGGSIGSELCRQAAGRHPRTLVLLGHGEYSIFTIHRELRERHPHLDLRPVIADVRDSRRLTGALAGLAPDVIFHAAAHKHVPLMEENAAEAITTTVLGTINVAELALAVGTNSMVLISTDKAVRPTSVMGASKRVAEQVVLDVASRSGRDFIAVRFGNVLGSRGSVVPLMLQQIEDGGPVTITHPDMRRYFMTIPEAVQLILQAAVAGRGGEVFVLDMGEPVRILDLAHDLIRLSGLEPNRDIEIRFTGIRPGEKLLEEPFFGPEVAVPGVHPKVLRAMQADVPAEFEALVADLTEAALQPQGERQLRVLLGRLVPDYAPGRALLEADQSAWPRALPSTTAPSAGRW